MDEWFEDVELIEHQFNVSTGSTKADLLTLDLEHIWKMKTEFNDEYDKFINVDEKRILLQRCHSMKIKAIDHQQKELKKAKTETEAESKE